MAIMVSESTKKGQKNLLPEKMHQNSSQLILCTILAHSNASANIAKMLSFLQ